MKKSLILIISFLSIVSGYYFYTSSGFQVIEKAVIKKNPNAVNKGTNPINNPKGNGKGVKTSSSKQFGDLKTVDSMTKEEGQKAAQETLKTSLVSDSTIEDFVKRLKLHKNNPKINREGDPSFGYVYSISLKNSFPGTRNFYAQYESTPNGQARVQRISFELPPGPESIRKAQEFFDSLPDVEKIVEEGEEFGRVQAKDGRHCWYKAMDEEWLAQPNPMHAYSKEDIGTVIVVCEDDIHPHVDGEEDSHEH